MSGLRIGLDLRIMQMGHQHRGIGQVMRRGVAALDSRLGADDRFVAHVDPGGPSVELELEGMVRSGRRIDRVSMPGGGPRLRRLLRDNVGEAQAATIASTSDAWIQFDPLVGVPVGLPSAAIVYDLIPLVLGNRHPRTYLPTFGGARRAGLDVRTAAEKAVRRHLYERNMGLALARAESLLAISHHTAAAITDLGIRSGVPDVGDRIQVVPLGADRPESTRGLYRGEQFRLESFALETTPFLVYFGGVDDRRRIDALIDAFNQLRAEGRDLRLVLAGDSMGSIDQIGIPSARRAIEDSSYRDDILLFGFVSEAERSWLYDHAAAMAFPSELEGFGLPVIEAMAHGCEVVSFAAGSIPEISGGHVRVVEPTWEGLLGGLREALDLEPGRRATRAEAMRRHADTFTWDPLGDALAGFVERLR